MRWFVATYLQMIFCSLVLHIYLQPLLLNSFVRSLMRKIVHDSVCLFVFFVCFFGFFVLHLYLDLHFHFWWKDIVVYIASYCNGYCCFFVRMNWLYYVIWSLCASLLFLRFFFCSFHRILLADGMYLPTPKEIAMEDVQFSPYELCTSFGTGFLKSGAVGISLEATYKVSCGDVTVFWLVCVHVVNLFFFFVSVCPLIIIFFLDLLAFRSDDCSWREDSQLDNICSWSEFKITRWWCFARACVRRHTFNRLYCPLKMSLNIPT